MKSVLREVDAEDQKLGSGWISGFLGLLLAIAGLATVLCFWYPQLLTVQDARGFYSNQEQWIRVLLSVVLIAAFLLGITSAVLRRQKILGFTTVALVLVATLMGGSKATSKLELTSDVYLGLDFFLLNLIFLGVLFIPIERLLKRVDQPILRYEWREDLLYFFISTLFVQSLTYLSLAPSLAALAATEWASSVRTAIAEPTLRGSVP